MSSVYGPMGAPTYRGITPSEFMTSALDQPLSTGSTFWESATSGMLQSFGLGTAIREFSTPDALEVPPEGETAGQTAERLYRSSGAMSLGAAVGQAAGLQLNEQRSLTEDQWKTSPYFRQGIPFDRGMTTERAKALADFCDAQKVRDFYAKKRPITAFFGNIAGQATDPINYVPLVGPEIRAAAALKMGKVAGAALTSSADAALNTGLAGVVTAPARAKFGDDVSWQATVTDMATAALIGGAFGAIFGKVDEVRDNRAMVRAQESLATLKRVQEARIALNDAVTGLARDGEVRLGGTSLNLVRKSAGDVEAATARKSVTEAGDSSQAGGELEAPPSHQPSSNMVVDEPPVPEGMVRVYHNGFNLDSNALGRRVTTDREHILADRLDAQDGDTINYIDLSKDDPRVRASVEAAKSGDLSASVFLLKAAEGERLKPLALKRQETAPAERVMPESSAMNSQTGVLSQAGQPTASVQDASQQVMGGRETASARGTVRDVANAVAARPVNAPSADAKQAGERASKPETISETAELHKVNPETGEYPEQADIEFLRSRGRVDPEEAAAIDDAAKTYELGSAYGDALKAAVRCLL